MSKEESDEFIKVVEECVVVRKSRVGIGAGLGEFQNEESGGKGVEEANKMRGGGGVHAGSPESALAMMKVLEKVEVVPFVVTLKFLLSAVC